MPFIRLSDTYIDHPKFLALSDRAFRLWHEGMAYCRKHQTDGVIPKAALKGFRYATGAAMKELSSEVAPGLSALWLAAEGCFHVHDYLDWNLSRDEEQRRQRDSAERTKKWRTSKSRDASQHPYVPDRIGSDQEEEEKVAPVSLPDSRHSGATDRALAGRAGALIRRYIDLYAKHRHGAKLRAGSNLDFVEACDLVRNWDDTRLDRLAEVVLTTDEDWISRTDRSFRIFASKASWADSRLAEVEARNGRS